MEGRKKKREEINKHLMESLHSGGRRKIQISGIYIIRRDHLASESV